MTLAAPATVIKYGLRGNMTTDGVFDFTWNSANQLTSAKPKTVVTLEQETKAHEQGNDLPASRKVEFGYDDAGRRIWKKSYVYSSAASAWLARETRKFVYDGNNLVADFVVDPNGMDRLSRAYAWGKGIAGSVGGLLSITTFADDGSTPTATYIPLYDDRGNVVGLANATDGKLVAVYQYDPFGKLIGEAGDKAVLDANPFQFSTKYFDRETGLYDFGFRFYSPVLQRWISRDPIAESGGVNLYAFVGNDPINRLDPLGLKIEWHHLLVKEVFVDGDSTFNKEHDFLSVLSGADFSANDGDFGWILTVGEHDKLHAAGWSEEWHKWALKQIELRKANPAHVITKQMVESHLSDLMGKPQYSAILKKGFRAEFGYHSKFYRTLNKQISIRVAKRRVSRQLALEALDTAKKRVGKTAAAGIGILIGMAERVSAGEPLGESAFKEAISAFPGAGFGVDAYDLYREFVKMEEEENDRMYRIVHRQREVPEWAKELVRGEDGQVQKIALVPEERYNELIEEKIDLHDLTLKRIRGEEKWFEGLELRELEAEAEVFSRLLNRRKDELPRFKELQELRQSRQKQ